MNSQKEEIQNPKHWHDTMNGEKRRRGRGGEVNGGGGGGGGACHVCTTLSRGNLSFF